MISSEPKCQIRKIHGEMFKKKVKWGQAKSIRIIISYRQANLNFNFFLTRSKISQSLFLNNMTARKRFKGEFRFETRPSDPRDDASRIRFASFLDATKSYGKVHVDRDWLRTLISNGYDHEKINIFVCFSLIIFQFHDQYLVCVKKYSIKNPKKISVNLPLKPPFFGLEKMKNTKYFAKKTSFSRCVFKKKHFWKPYEILSFMGRNKKCLWFFIFSSNPP